MGLSIPVGSRVLTGAPARPPDRAVVESIVGALALTGGIAEAHLPMCMIEGVMTGPELVLIVGVYDLLGSEMCVADLRTRIRQLLPSGEHLNVWPLGVDNPVLKAVRDARCRIFIREI